MILGDPDNDVSLLRPMDLHTSEGELSTEKPIVIINSDVGSDGLIEFALALQSRGSSGVIGPVVPVTAHIAELLGNRLVWHIISGSGVGSAVRDSRLDLLSAGDSLGLAYTVFANPSLEIAVQRPVDVSRP